MSRNGEGGQGGRYPLPPRPTNTQFESERDSTVDIRSAEETRNATRSLIRRILRDGSVKGEKLA